MSFIDFFIRYYNNSLQITSEKIFQTVSLAQCRYVYSLLCVQELFHVNQTYLFFLIN